ncbi:MAG: universal stress protein [Bacteroidales bacterium]|jgi:nucleotide-binding universal stress UspA family protein|nr:universal stress protein [Bacteroidales bacterium]
MEKCILVPHDFTEVGDYAIEHAVAISKNVKLPIHILHIVKKTEEIGFAKEKLSDLVKKISKEKNFDDIDFVISVRKGNIYKEIYKYGLEIDAYIAVMGTHGIKNVKKTMKVVKKFVKIPFILVQSPMKNPEYRNILLPIDSEKNSRIKAQWVNYLNFLFKSIAYIVTSEEKETDKARDLKNNLHFVESYFEDQLIEYGINSLSSGKKFADEMYSYAKEIDADIILIMTHSYRSYIKDIKKVENLEQFKQIPIMCVNKRTDIKKVGGFN